MDHREVGRYWERNAEAWIQLEEQGYNVYRDHINTPAFLELLPDVSHLRGLDIGCGPGAVTRQIAERAGGMVAIDISSRFIGHAVQRERSDPRGTVFLQGSALELPFIDASFDFVVATMSLMDIPDTERVLVEVNRVLRRGGFLQFSILHPCFTPRNMAWEKDAAGRPIALRISHYFDPDPAWIDVWTFTAAPEEARQNLDPFQVPRFDRTLDQWLNIVAEVGFSFERAREPRVTKSSVRSHPKLEDALLAPIFFQSRWRKRSA